MNFITFAVLLLSLTVVPAYSKRGKAVTKLLCPRVSLPNGRIRYQKSGREVRFRCLATYKALGDVNAACVRGRWTAPPPVCVKRGCGPAADPANGAWQPSLGGAVASLVCDPGHALASAADSDIYCNGASWRPRRGPPQCRAIIETRKTTCDFETEDLCGWGQDMSLESIWIRNNYSTPSGYMQTGPSFDHTFGEGFGGHYMFVESSSPRKENDIARLYSPVYSQELAEDGCFMFWYNMYGINTGSLKVYIKPQTTSLKDLDASFLKSGNQGPRWIQAMVPLTSVNESFQVIIEAIRGNGFLGDSAIDDVALRKGSDCVIIPDQPITAAPITAAIRQANKTPRVSPAKTVIIVLVVTLTVLLIAVLAFFVVRKRLRLRRLRNVTEDSDVRYLTSDEILDFNMARPADD